MKINIKQCALATLLVVSQAVMPGAVAQSVLLPQPTQPGEAWEKVDVNSKQGVYEIGNELLTARFVCSNGKLLFDGCEALRLLPTKQLFVIELQDGKRFSSADMQLTGVGTRRLVPDERAARGSSRLFGHAIWANFTRGDITVKWQAVLRDGSHYLRTEMTIESAADVAMRGITPMTYNVKCDAAEQMPQVVGNTRGAVLVNDLFFAGLETPMGVNSAAKSKKRGEATITGYWHRTDVLTPDEPWQVSAVVGLMAQNQARRSFLAYSERERAVPWRPMPVYISWYELNIDRNNAKHPEYKGNMTDIQCLDVVNHWFRSFYLKYGLKPKAFVWDDGWDEYGTWHFNPNFPQRFDIIDMAARAMGSGIGAWLGPVGGYGESGTYRRNYWKNNGGMQLSNREYYKYFIDACTDMVRSYDFRFFKFDGISAQSSSVGPDEGDVGCNNAEAIIRIESAVRRARPDIFINTTVGTWASPFWFRFTDAVWRQEADYSEIGVGTDRERWITYRDRLVYQNFVQRSPICPINTLMTHGFILSKWGAVSKNMDYDGIVREMRCAFACGSGMVELYCDYELMDSIRDDKGRAGVLWADLADCIKWQERCADVLPDVHWVGGNPWNGETTEIYGWAAWNGKRCTLALRNGDVKPRTITITLREALDVPQYVTGKVKLSSSFSRQTAPEGLPVGKEVDLDARLTINLVPSSVFVAEGVCK
ncbi:MAG: hypothetical protein ACI308_00365 [Muribaculaceae bacterium]